jgi:hypothetical protein
MPTKKPTQAAIFFGFAGVIKSGWKRGGVSLRANRRKKYARLPSILTLVRTWVDSRQYKTINNINAQLWTRIPGDTQANGWT